MDDPAILRVSGLTFTYPGGQTALRDIRLEANPGESIGLIGPNGAGKTTLFLCLTGVLRPAREMVRVCGLDPAISDERRRLPAHVGIVFQNSDDQLIQATVRDDVAFGPLNLGLPADEVRERVRFALEHVGLSGLEDRAPFHLSGGDKRRAALAGVLAMRPDVLLLDEPTMFLDPRGRRELESFLASLPGTRLIASHDLEFVRRTCGRVLLLDAGVLAAAGAPDDVLADAALMEAHGLEVPYSLR